MFSPEIPSTYPYTHTRTRIEYADPLSAPNQICKSIYGYNMPYMGRTRIRSSERRRIFIHTTPALRFKPSARRTRTARSRFHYSNIYVDETRAPGCTGSQAEAANANERVDDESWEAELGVPQFVRSASHSYGHCMLLSGLP